jgi:antitoxin ParD1/3/4
MTPVMPTRTRRLRVSITPDLTRVIEEKVKSGRYNNASEVVRDALRHMDRDELLEEQTELADPDNIYEELQKAHASLERGESITLRDEAELHAFFEDIIARGRQRLKSEKTRSALRHRPR